MQKVLSLLLLTLLLAPVAPAEDDDRDDDKSSNLNSTAERPPNMANPEKPGWLPQRHGK
ncbi:MAG: hypothetical protein O3B89_06670 [Verrucomicrobia bacterium]|nr:hypothetical protein [Verrucomicrobiota bacterium]